MKKGQSPGHVQTLPVRHARLFVEFPSALPHEARLFEEEQLVIRHSTRQDLEARRVGEQELDGARVLARTLNRIRVDAGHARHILEPDHPRNESGVARGAGMLLLQSIYCYYIDESGTNLVSREVQVSGYEGAMLQRGLSAGGCFTWLAQLFHMASLNCFK